jgi:hypothetical protein
MVIEAFHAGRQVPCPWCRATNEVPRELDFKALARAQTSDESRGAWFLAGACVAFSTMLLPLSAWIWWAAHGRLSRAEDEGRPGDSMVKAAKWIAIVACVYQGLVVSLFVLSALR